MRDNQMSENQYLDEDTRPQYMWTTDRVAQCNWLRQLAGDIYGYYVADPADRYTGAEVVAAWEESLRENHEKLPDWYDAHDQRLLAGYIQDRLDAHWAARS
jgi:hypothetical protein